MLGREDDSRLLGAHNLGQIGGGLADALGERPQTLSSALLIRDSAANQSSDSTRSASTPTA